MSKWSYKHALVLCPIVFTAKQRAMPCTSSIDYYNLLYLDHNALFFKHYPRSPGQKSLSHSWAQRKHKYHEVQVLQGKQKVPDIWNYKAKSPQ